MNLFFFIPHILAEYIAMTKNNWWFPGNHFIGYVSTAGITIPLEELGWILLFIPATIAVYELLADDLV